MIQDLVHSHSQPSSNLSPINAALSNTSSGHLYSSYQNQQSQSRKIDQENYSKIEAIIKKILLFPQLLRRPLILSVDWKHNFCLSVSQNCENLCIEGCLVYKNLSQVKLKEGYRINLVRNINKKTKNEVTFCIRDQKLIFRIKGKLKMIGNEADPNSLDIRPLVQKIRKAVDIVRNELLVFGQHSQFNKKLIEIKKERLILQLAISRVLSNQVEKQKDEEQKKGVVVHSCQQIEQVKKSIEYYEFEEEQLIGANSVFEIKKDKFKIKESSKQGEKEMELIRKSLNKEHLNKKFKIQRQKQVIQQIISSKYFIQYWFSETDSNSIYMQYVKENLDDHIFCYENSVGEILELAKQVAQGAQALQRSGIVHRDLKPQNILVEQNQNKIRSIKIIDFGQSTLMNEKFGEKMQHQFLGSTIPYSAPQTMYKVQQSFNKKQMDYWSVGMIIYELVYQTCPIYYFKDLGRDIYKLLWQSPQDFTVGANIRKKGGIKIIEYLINILCLNALRIKQSERVDSCKMEKLLEEGQKFISKFLL